MQIGRYDIKSLLVIIIKSVLHYFDKPTETIGANLTFNNKIMDILNYKNAINKPNKIYILTSIYFYFIIWNSWFLYYDLGMFYLFLI